MSKRLISLLTLTCLSQVIHATQWQFMFAINNATKQGEQISIYIDKDSISRKGDIADLTVRFDSSVFPNSSVDCKNKKLFLQGAAAPYSLDSDNPILTLACSSKWERFWSK